MKTYTAREARTYFGAFINDAQHGPVRVMRRGLMVGVLVSAQDYEAAQTFYAERLRQTIKKTAELAALAGLTTEVLDDLLADES